VSTEFSPDDLNVLFDAALEFGTNWRRPIGDLAAERLPGRPDEFLEAIAAAVERYRCEIESRVEAQYEACSGAWTQAETARVDSWLVERFGWMTPENRQHAIGQGVYYAWHG
jgi:hypothetical protein